MILQAQALNWARSMGGSGADQGLSNIVDAAGNVFTTGFFSGTVDFAPGAGVQELVSNGEKDLFIQKLDAAGVLVWVKSMGGSGSDVGLSITLDAAGNVYTTGYFSDTVDFDPGTGTQQLIARGEEDVYVQKLDADGNFLWVASIAGTNIERGQSIQVDASGNVYTTGWFTGMADFDPSANILEIQGAGGRDIFVQKLDANGDLLWAKCMGGPNPERGQSLALDASGNIYLTGFFQGTADFDPDAGSFPLTSAGERDIFLTKLTPNGALLWAKRMGGIGADRGQSITVDPWGHVYSTGFFSDTVDFDPGAGVTFLESKGGRDVYLQKFDAEGNFIWAKCVGGPEEDFGLSVTSDPMGNIYSTGYFEGIADFDPNAGTNILTSNGNRDIYIQSMNPDGNLLWATSMGGSGMDIGESLSLDASGMLYVAGFFEEEIDTKPGAGTSYLSAAGGSDIFVIGLDPSVKVSIDKSKLSSFKVYPNPGNGVFHVEVPLRAIHARIEIVDQLGRRLSQQTLSQLKQEINLSHLPDGVYQLFMSLPSGERFHGQILLRR